MGNKKMGINLCSFVENSPRPTFSDLFQSLVLLLHFSHPQNVTMKRTGLSLLAFVTGVLTFVSCKDNKAKQDIVQKPDTSITKQNAYNPLFLDSSAISA